MRAIQRLLAHNVSPARESWKCTRSELQGAEVCYESSKGSCHNSPPRREHRSKSKSSSGSKSKSSSRSDLPHDTPSWAPWGSWKERGASAIPRKGTEVSAVYRAIPRKKIQYELNEKVLDKLDVAASSSDEKARNDALEEEGKSSRNEIYILC